MSIGPSIRSRSRPAAVPAPSVDVKGINRKLNTLLQSQLWTETSGGSFADTRARLYQQLQQIYGTPASPGAFDTAYNNFTNALQGLTTSPSSYSAQTAVLSAAQQLTQHLNSMTGGIQAMRSQAEQGISDRNSAGQSGHADHRADQPKAVGDLTAGRHHGDARRSARSGRHPALAADEYHRRQERQRSDRGIHRLGSATGRGAGFPARVRRPGLAFGDFALECKRRRRTVPAPLR